MKSASKDLVFLQIPVGPMKNFSYIIGDPKTKEGAIVDTGWDIDKLLSTAKDHSLKIISIIQTHGHYDHIQKLPEAVKKIGAKVIIHKDEPFENKNYDVQFVEDQDIINIGALPIRVHHTPGHTMGAICLEIEGKLITGDTLFVGGCGRVDLPGADPRKMAESLKKLKAMNDELEIYPGHDYGTTPSSTIGREKKENRFLTYI